MNHHQVSGALANGATRATVVGLSTCETSHIVLGFLDSLAASGGSWYVRFGVSIVRSIIMKWQADEGCT